MGDSTEQQATEDARRREELIEKVREANRLSANRPGAPTAPGPVAPADEDG
ncbi:hypothetical protein ACFYMW_01805 [Streptomyces sp. NPDC006692]|uniref:hypothetical protein n=1 Tax=Streptomyces sp. NPDC006692 TaxID=3364758 RepID=UPI0036AF30BC